MSEKGVPRLLFRVTDIWGSEKYPLQVTSDTEHVDGYRSGDELELRRLDGTRLRVKSGLVHVQKDWRIALSEPDRKWPLIFWLGDVKEADVPIGTEIWLVTEHPPEQPKGRLRFEKISEP